MKRAVLVASVLWLSTFAFGKDAPIKVSTITNADEPASAEMMKLFREQLRAHPNLFELVGNDDVSQGLLITADCMKRDASTSPYVCFYTSHYAGATSKTFLGGGIYVGKTANEIVTSFVASVAQDIVQSWSKTARTNTIEELGSLSIPYAVNLCGAEYSSARVEDQSLKPLSILAERWPEEVTRFLKTVLKHYLFEHLEIPQYLPSMPLMNHKCRVLISCVE